MNELQDILDDVKSDLDRIGTPGSTAGIALDNTYRRLLRYVGRQTASNPVAVPDAATIAWHNHAADELVEIAKALDVQTIRVGVNEVLYAVRHLIADRDAARSALTRLSEGLIALGSQYHPGNAVDGALAVIRLLRECEQGIKGLADELRERGYETGVIGDGPYRPEELVNVALSAIDGYRERQGELARAGSELHRLAGALTERGIVAHHGNSVNLAIAAIDRLRNDATKPAIDIEHLTRQREWSRKTFGPGRRTHGVIDHIRKELAEIEAEPHDLSEWIDVVILALDGAWRHGAQPEEIIVAIKEKQAVNESRTWPDWRTRSDNKAIEHDRAVDPAPVLPTGLERPEIASEHGEDLPDGGWVTNTDCPDDPLPCCPDAAVHSGCGEQIWYSTNNRWGCNYHLDGWHIAAYVNGETVLAVWREPNGGRGDG